MLIDMASAMSASRSPAASRASTWRSRSDRTEQLMETLRQQVTIVIVTHNMHQAARVADVTAFFYMGKLVESGATQRIFSNPVEKRTEDYVTGRFG